MQDRFAEGLASHLQRQGCTTEGRQLQQQQQQLASPPEPPLPLPDAASSLDGNGTMLEDIAVRTCSFRSSYAWFLLFLRFPFVSVFQYNALDM